MYGCAFDAIARLVRRLIHSPHLFVFGPDLRDRRVGTITGNSFGGSRQSTVGFVCPNDAKTAYLNRIGIQAGSPSLAWGGFSARVHTPC
jgi:hypothetical protein